MTVTPASSPARPLAALLLACTIAGFEAGAVGYVLPAMREALAADTYTASWLVSAYVMGMLAGIPLAGIAALRFGAGPLLWIALAVSMGGAALALLGHSFAVLLVARVLQGFGHGPIPALATALVAQRWPAERQGRTLGTLSLTYGVAFLAATLLMPPLLQLGWRVSFAFGAVLSAVALIAARGVASRGAAVSAVAQHIADKVPWPTAVRRALTPGVAALALLCVATGIGQALLVWFPTVAIARVGVPAAATAVPMLPLVVGGIAATLAITAWLDRLGARVVVAASAFAALAGLLVAVLMPPSLAAFMAGVGLFGFGVVGLCGGPLRYAVAQMLPAHAQAPAQSAVTLLTDLGLLGGTMLVGATAEGAGIERALLAAGAAMAVSFLAIRLLPPHRPLPAPAPAGS